MNLAEEKLFSIYENVRRKVNFAPRVALVLGSGLGDFANEIQLEQVLEYKDIEGFPVSTVSGHAGRFIFGFLEGVPVVCMQGRVHFYEGYTMQDVVLPVRLMGLLGAQKLILTNAAGGVNPSFRPGDLMMITDHISSFVPPALAGPNFARLGTRFPDMSQVYSVGLQDILRKVARERGISLREGVYLQASGPNYETPAEIRMFRGMGADAVGMSTACEAMAAVHMGLEVCGISCISNLAAGMSSVPLSHEEIKVAADSAAPRFKALVRGIIGKF